MADNMLPGVQEPVATDDIGGVHHQRVKTGYGANGAYSDVAADNGLPIGGSHAEYTATFTAASTVFIGPIDARPYKSWSLQLAGGHASNTATVEVSNDGTTWFRIYGTQFGSGSNEGFNSQSIGSANMQVGQVCGRYLRVRSVLYTSGTSTGYLELFAYSYFPTGTSSGSLLVNIGGGTAQVQGLSGATDGAAVSSSQLYVVPGIYNGTTVDRWRNVSSVDGQGSTGVPAVGLVGLDSVSSVNRRLRCDSVGTVFASPTPSTTGGWSVSSQTALSNTKTQIKASAGTLGGYMIYNPDAAVAYVQVFDVANASITVGTTAPTYVLSIPAGSATNLELTCGVSHTAAINVAATTTPTGSTAPATALTCAFFYK